MSRHHSMSLDKRKLEQSLIWVHGSVFSKLVYFGQEGLKILTTVYNCFITLRFILIGTSKVPYFAECQSCGMCCSPVCTQVHSRVALGRGRCKWSDRGLGGADTSHRTNHLLLSSAALEWKKDKERIGRDELEFGVGRGGGLDGKAWMQNVAIILHLIAFLKRSTHTSKTWEIHFVLFWRTAGALLLEVIMAIAKKQQQSNPILQSFIGYVNTFIPWDAEK